MAALYTEESVDVYLKGHSYTRMICHHLDRLDLLQSRPKAESTKNVIIRVVLLD
jgi:hypothetical protein